MHSWKHVGNTLFALAVFGSLGAIFYVNRERYIPVYENFMSFAGLDEPCSKPIVYYIDQFNPKFGQTEQEFKNNLTTAASIWNNALGKELLRYSREEADKMYDLSKRKLPINLIYDQRQATTEQLKTIGSTIDSNKDSYANQKTRYDSLKNQYETKKQSLQNLIANYEINKANYQKEVSYWNSQGGAPKKEYSNLEKQRLALNAETQIINTTNQELNQIVIELNKLVAILNTMNKDINQKIGTFNEISLSNGPEFQEGEYVVDEFGQRINIYEYKDYNKLIRVLAHEFGHSLGLDHVEGEDSIMNAYNTSTNLRLTSEDISALKAVCQVK